MTREALLEQMKAALADVSDTVDWSTITEEDNLITDLGFDSLTMMLVSIKLEDTFHITIPDAVVFHTVRDVCDFIEEVI